MYTLLIFLLVLSTLILIHELGHFIAAKLAGITVEEFGLGLPPKILTIFDDGETKYTLNLLPIGGFVRLHGEEDSYTQYESINSRAFFNKPALVRFLIIVAGVLMNYLLGVILMSIVFSKMGVPIMENVLEIQTVNNNSPAADIHLEDGDQILGFFDLSNQNLIKIQSTQQFLDFIDKNKGTSVELAVLKKQELQTEQVTKVTITPRLITPTGEGPIGITFVELPKVRYEPIPWWQIPPRAIVETSKFVLLMFQGIGTMLTELVTKGIIPKDMTGPVGIAKLTGEVAKHGFFQLLQFTALISINLAVINILPFPALDGGRLAFIAAEGVLGRRLNPKYEKWINTIGLFSLLTLIVIITIYDIKRYF